MPVDPSARSIHWKLHLRSSPQRVFEMLATAEGRARFWAESAEQEGDAIDFVFPNGQRLRAVILAAESPGLFAVEYLSGSRAEFRLASHPAGGTILELTETGVHAAELIENAAGWVSVLLSLKAAVDFDVDLRNHSPALSWDSGFVDN